MKIGLKFRIYPDRQQKKLIHQTTDKLNPIDENQINNKIIKNLNKNNVLASSQKHDRVNSIVSLVEKP